MSHSEKRGESCAVIGFLNMEVLYLQDQGAENVFTEDRTIWTTKSQMSVIHQDKQHLLNI